MNLRLFLPLLFVIFSFTSVSASFPVKRAAATHQNTTISEDSKADLYTPAAAAAGYDKWVAVAFWFFLGVFAAHRWYAKKPTGWNILYILTLGGLGVWAIVDLINILTDNFN
ncbi:TM2 domain-containing protein [Cellulophaga sp. Hel_I_12]|uniref:TM2 domain-containing protein n=1 Tax=Cellulophaga sp. Hel_I_12 TaxID=1249972 RepID=UPI000645FF93|nr:TM2 domain-containing protein [Cellulophaga sp. Hel_I_12]